MTVLLGMVLPRVVHHRAALRQDHSPRHMAEGAARGDGFTVCCDSPFALCSVDPFTGLLGTEGESHASQ